MRANQIRLWIGPTPSNPIRRFKLKRKVYGTLFFWPGTDFHVRLVDMPTLKEAKELAESYYKQWLQVKKEAQDDAS